GREHRRPACSDRRPHPPRGKDLIVPVFRRYSGQMRRVFSELSKEELHGLEVALKKIGKRAAVLMVERG
ncbi:MAG: hypothetical protein WA400_19525, partial [Silvibacterium sp.]